MNEWMDEWINELNVVPVSFWWVGGSLLSGTQKERMLISKLLKKIAKVTEKFDDQEAMKYWVFRFSSVYKSFWFVYFW
jgi:hypothetical protein